MRDLENDYLRGNKVAYPETLTKAYEIAVNWKGSGQRRPRNASRHHELGSTFVQDTHTRQAPHNYKPRPQGYKPQAQKPAYNNGGANRKIISKPK